MAIGVEGHHGASVIDRDESAAQRVEQPGAEGGVYKQHTRYIGALR